MTSPVTEQELELQADADRVEQAEQGVAGGRTSSAGFRARFMRKRLGVVALGFVLLVVLAAILAPLVGRYDPITADLTNPLSGPSAAHWLGTDGLGRDTWSRLVWGARPTLLYALEPVVVSLLIGLPLGLAAGYFGGCADRIIMWVTEVGMAVPGVVLLLVVLSMFSGQFWLAMAFFGVLAAPPLIRFVRGATLNVRRELFIDAALVAGRSHGYILWKHVVPRIRGLMLVQITLLTAGGVMMMAGMGYLGYGPKPPNPTWGSMITEAQQVMAMSPWLLIFSGAATGLTVLSLGLVGDAVRDASVEAWAHFPVTRSRRGSRHRSRRAAASGGNSAASTSAVAQPTRAEAGALALPTGLLVVDGLSVAYRRDGEQVGVLDRVSFSIQPGERVALVGESGCGKSTVAGAVVALLSSTGEITGGSITFDGNDVRELEAERLRSYHGSSVGYVSQEPMSALDPSFRIGSQLVEVIRAHERKHPDPKGRARELLEMVRIPDVERVMASYPHELSGGMAQRVAIARALAGNPRLLVADEPTTALDVTVQAEILGLILTLAEERNLAVLLISHDWGVVSRLCTRAIVMYAGQVVEQGPVAALLTQSAHPYTRGLLACRPDGSTEGLLPVIPGTVPDPRDWTATCRFAARCHLATDACRSSVVPVVNVGRAHESRCLRTDVLVGERDSTEVRS